MERKKFREEILFILSYLELYEEYFSCIFTFIFWQPIKISGNFFLIHVSY
jgi:hypothetical protein